MTIFAACLRPTNEIFNQYFFNHLNFNAMKKRIWTIIRTCRYYGEVTLCTCLTHEAAKDFIDNYPLKKSYARAESITWISKLI